MKFKLADALLLTLFALYRLVPVHSVYYAMDANPASSLDFGTALKMYYTSFQKVMPCGYPPYQLPVLVPYSFNFWQFNYTNEYYSFIGNVSNAMVMGLNNYQVLAGKYNSTTQRTTYDIVYPELRLYGAYVFNAYILVGGYPVYTAGKGLLDTKVIDARLFGDFILKPSPYNSQSLRVTDFNLNFNFADIRVSNWNNYWNIAENNFWNSWISDFSLMWSQQIQTKVNEIYAQLLLPNLNGFLEGVNMTQLIDFFVNEAQAFNMADCKLN